MKELSINEVFFLEDQIGIRILRPIGGDWARQIYFGCSYVGLLKIIPAFQGIKIGESASIKTKIGESMISKIDVDVVEFNGLLYEGSEIIESSGFIIHISTLKQIQDLVYSPPENYIPGPMVFVDGVSWRVL